MKTYLAILSQIEKLKKEAETLKARERSGVIDRIREAISVYEITVKELTGPVKLKAQQPKRKRTGVALPIKYADGVGNIWSGYGHRPDWLKNKIASGHSVEEFRVKPNKAGGNKW